MSTGIVFRAARQHLHHAADFLVATDDGINLSLPRERREIATVFFQRLKFGFGIFVRHALVAAQLGERFQNRVAFQTVLGENLFQRRAAAVQQTEQQMFGADVFVLEFGGLGLRGVERLAQIGAGVRFAAALHFVTPREFRFQIRFQLRHAARRCVPANRE